MEKFISIKELQTLIGCGRNKVYEIIATKTIKAIKIGKQYYIPESEYARWIENNKGRTITL